MCVITTQNSLYSLHMTLSHPPSIDEMPNKSVWYQIKQISLLYPITSKLYSSLKSSNLLQRNPHIQSQQKGNPRLPPVCQKLIMHQHTWGRVKQGMLSTILKKGSKDEDHAHFTNQIFLLFMTYKQVQNTACPSNHNNTKLWKLYHLGKINGFCCPPAPLLAQLNYWTYWLMFILLAAVACAFLTALIQYMDKLSLNICRLLCVQTPTVWTAPWWSYYSQCRGRVTRIAIKYLLLTLFRRTALRDGLSLCHVTSNGRKCLSIK